MYGYSERTACKIDRKDEGKKRKLGPYVAGNPGLSDEAWDNLHKLVARLQVKYGKQLAELERQKKNKDSETK